MIPEIPASFRGVSPEILILDVDGVLTPNLIYLDGDGREFKPFFVPDGTGIKLLQRADVLVALISGRASPVVHRRAEELSIEDHLSGVLVKAPAVEELLDRKGIDPAHAVYVGDDLIDIPPMRRVGLPVAVADAHPLVRAAAKEVTTHKGGEGAVRQVCEWILAARGVWDEIVGRYLE